MVATFFDGGGDRNYRSMNFELVDVEYVKEGGMNYLRAYIDKEVFYPQTSTVSENRSKG